ncbi:hypothetical protein [Actinoplanes sp. NPDC023714]|uniref:hypothetical protein n=1 Tax=Actinoplanes sp. NPDC023714 TaxID=3154322 RepID=UPI0033F9B8B3
MAVDEQRPLPVGVAARAVARCVITSARLLASGRITLPVSHRGMRLRFGDGTESWVYRETALRPVASRDPCVLVVGFRLRLVRGRGHRWFRAESLLNTPLFAGFPGLVSKLWMAHDENGCYRGVYEWDGPGRAEDYARALWRVLQLVSVPGSIGYRVVPGLRLRDLLADPGLLGGRSSPNPADWWRPVVVLP